MRNNLSQDKIKKGCVVTLDCFFYPPNLLNAGLVAATKGDKVEIWFLTGKVEIANKSAVFKFPSSCRVYQLRAFIVRKHRIIKKKKKLEEGKLKEANKDSEIIVIG